MHQYLPVPRPGLNQRAAAREADTRHARAREVGLVDRRASHRPASAAAGGQVQALRRVAARVRLRPRERDRQRPPLENGSSDVVDPRPPRHDRPRSRDLARRRHPRLEQRVRRSSPTPRPQHMQHPVRSTSNPALTRQRPDPGTDQRPRAGRAGPRARRAGCHRRAEDRQRHRRAEEHHPAHARTTTKTQSKTHTSPDTTAYWSWNDNTLSAVGLSAAERHGQFRPHQPTATRPPIALRRRHFNQTAGATMTR